MARHRIISRLAVLFGMAGVAAASLSGCGGGGGGGGSSSVIVTTGDLTGIGGNGTGAVISASTASGRAACAPNSHVAGRARWTLLIYLNSANNLNDKDSYNNINGGISDALYNVAQMATTGSNADVNVVLQWKQASGIDSQQTPTFNETRRYLIKPHSAADITQIVAGNTSVLDADKLPFNSVYYNTSTKQVDMGNWQVLQDFVHWGSTTYPADNLAVVVWDHGSGWQTVPANDRSSKRKPSRAVSIDNQTHNEIETEQLPGAFSQAAQPIDALIFDASLLQMGEIEYEVRNSAKVMVGSEESPPALGYQYDKMITDLKSGSDTDGCAMGASVVTRFTNYYADLSRDGIADSTQSVIDLSKMQSVATALDNFAGSLITHRADQAPVIQSARQNAQAYDYPEYKDLYDFADRVRANTTATDLQQSAIALQTAITGSGGAVIISGHDQGHPGSHGMALTVPEPNLALYFPDNFTTYLDLAISQSGAAPRWYQFCTQQVQ